MKRILIVDDDVAVTNYLNVFLVQSGLFEPSVVNDSREVAALLERENFDVILLDLDMPNVSGMDVLQAMRQNRIETPVVILTGVSDVDLAVKSMKLGAFDYLIKPADDDKLLEVLDNAIEHRALHRSIEQLPEELTRGGLAHKAAFAHFPTQDKKMIRLFHQAEKVASSDLSIFIWGERYGQGGYCQGDSRGQREKGQALRGFGGQQPGSGQIPGVLLRTGEGLEGFPGGDSRHFGGIQSWDDVSQQYRCAFADHAGPSQACYSDR